MPQMNVHTCDHRNAEIEFRTSTDGNVHWITFKNPAGEYLTIFFDTGKDSLRFLTLLETAIDQAFDRLIGNLIGE
jgi:hypothetical protein